VISSGVAVVTSPLCPALEKGTMHQPELKSEIPAQ
jgi:hypothetical protein